MTEHHAAPGPYDTEAQARGAVAHIYASPVPSMTDGCLRLLEEALRAAGVELGAYDHATALWLAGGLPARAAVIAGWVTRAAEPSRTPLQELMGPPGAAQPGGGWINGSMGGRP